MADRKRWIPPVLVLLLVAASLGWRPGFAAEAPNPEDWSIETRREAFTPDGAARVELDLGVGDIRIEGANVDSVIVTMVIQHHKDDPRRAVVRRSEEGFALTIGFTEADAAAPGPEAEPESWSRRRIDVGVQVPRDLDLVVRTGAGLIELENLDGFADLTTETGEIEVDGAGGLHARSKRGSIHVLVRSTQSDEPITLESVNGNVWAQLLEGASASVELETTEQIATDYSLKIRREHGSRHKIGHATVGEGRRNIRLVTVNGQARLSNVIVDEGTPDPD